MTKWPMERQNILNICQKLSSLGLATNASGNVSQRLSSNSGDLILITPHGRSLDRLELSELSVMDLDGEPIEEDLIPSSESALHLSIYKSRKDVKGVVHSHPIFSSVAAVSLDEIPPIIDEMVINIGGSIKVAEYAFPGTEELASKAVEALGERKAVLLRNHGLITVGKTIEEALDINILVERLAQIYVYVYLMKSSNPLPDEVIMIEHELYKMNNFPPEIPENTDGNNS